MSVWGRALAVALTTLTACASQPAPEALRAIARLDASMTAHDAALDEAEEKVKQLSASFRAVREAYEAARRGYAEASATYGAAREASAHGLRDAQAAARDYEAATQAWRWYQKLVVIAAAIDAANLDTYRAWRRPGEVAEPFSCEPVSTRQFRRQLEAQGVDLTGLDVDHIVPRSLGGADHPGNYQLLPSAENRSLGATWDLAKCVDAGDACATAVAVSQRCSSYAGGYPSL